MTEANESKKSMSDVDPTTLKFEGDRFEATAMSLCSSPELWSVFTFGGRYTLSILRDGDAEAWLVKVWTEFGWRDLCHTRQGGKCLVSDALALAIAILFSSPLPKLAEEPTEDPAKERGV